MSVSQGAWAWHRQVGVECGGVSLVHQDDEAEGKRSVMVASFGSDGWVRLWGVRDSGVLELHSGFEVEGGRHAVNAVCGQKDRLCIGVGAREEGVEVAEALLIWRC